MRRDCTFVAWSDKFFDGYVSFEAIDQPDHWIRQKNRQLEVTQIQTYKDNNDASFLLSERSFVPETTTAAVETTTAAPGNSDLVIKEIKLCSAKYNIAIFQTNLYLSQLLKQE